MNIIIGVTALYAIMVSACVYYNIKRLKEEVEDFKQRVIDIEADIY